MNQVDIYVNDVRLDLFDDEEISINLSVQNVQDISKVFTDFTQGFTVPATITNNRVFSYYYRTDLEGSFDGRIRVSARIEINSLPFRVGVIELENVQLKGTEPYAYSLTFYGDLVNLTDLFGDDYLYDLDFSELDFEYTDYEILDRLTTDTGVLFVPLMSPVKNWNYDSGSGSHDDNNIAWHGGHGQPHGIHYYEFKPALKVTAILDAIQAKYGIVFSGLFKSETPFIDLSLWLHRAEGYLFANGNDIAWTLINFNRNTGSGSDFNLTTETWTSPADNDYRFVVTMGSATENYELGIFFNNQIQSTSLVDAHVTTDQRTFDIYVPLGAEVQLFIRPQQPTSMTFQCTDYSCDQLDRETQTPVANEFSVDQTGTQSISFRLIVSDLMPEMRVVDFLSGIVKMHNLVIVPQSANNYLLQPLQDWYDDGTDQNYQEYLDITEYSVSRPPLYKEIAFKYQETQQILGAQYRNTNVTGYGDLMAFFTFDGDNFEIQLPFECPLFERLSNIDPEAEPLTNVLVYKSITNEIADDGVSFKPYLGKPILFYAYYGEYDISSNPISFVDADETTEHQVTTCWYANTSNRSSAAGDSDSICFGADIDPYHLQSVSKSLYYNYWTEYISSLYSKQRRIIQVEAVLPIGKIISMNLANAVIWNNNKYIVNSVSLNMTTGKATFELLNIV